MAFNALRVIMVRVPMLLTVWLLESMLIRIFWVELIQLLGMSTSLAHRLPLTSNMTSGHRADLRFLMGLCLFDLEAPLFFLLLENGLDLPHISLIQHESKILKLG